MWPLGKNKFGQAQLQSERSWRSGTCVPLLSRQHNGRSDVGLCPLWSQQTATCDPLYKWTTLAVQTCQFFCTWDDKRHSIQRGARFPNPRREIGHSEDLSPEITNCGQEEASSHALVHGFYSATASRYPQERASRYKGSFLGNRKRRLLIIISAEARNRGNDFMGWSCRDNRRQNLDRHDYGSGYRTRSDEECSRVHATQDQVGHYFIILVLIFRLCDSVS